MIMSKVLMYREGTVYSAAKYIANVNNVDEHIKTLCEMIQLIYTTIPEGKMVDNILTYDILKALQEICNITGIEFDFNLDYICDVEIGESKHHEWISSMIKDETREICKRYDLVTPTNAMIDYGVPSNLSAVGMLNLWMHNKGEKGMYRSE
jgi:ethanolamine ammonia-lyase large subunit